MIAGVIAASMALLWIFVIGPAYSNLLIVANEAGTLAALGKLKSAVQLYYGDTEGKSVGNIRAIIACFPGSQSLFPSLEI